MSWLNESRDNNKNFETNEGNKRNKFLESLRVPEAKDKEKLSKKADGNASGSNNDGGDYKEERIRDRAKEWKPKENDSKKKNYDDMER